MYIEQSELDEVLEILSRLVPQYEVWAFGSRVSGKNLRKFSDLDLAIITDKKLGNLWKIKDAFSLSQLPFSVDIIDWTKTEDYFKDIIKKEYEVIQNPYS